MNTKRKNIASRLGAKNISNKKWIARELLLCLMAVLILPCLQTSAASKRVVYNYNGGVINAKTMLVMPLTTVPNIAPQYPSNQYEFKGWSPNKMHPETPYDNHNDYDSVNFYHAGDTVALKGSTLTLYAVWGLHELDMETRYTITCRYIQADDDITHSLLKLPNNFILREDVYTIPAGSSITLPAVGWTQGPYVMGMYEWVGYIDNDENKKVPAPGYTPTSDITIYYKMYTRDDPSFQGNPYGMGEYAEVEGAVTVAYINNDDSVTGHTGTKLPADVYGSGMPGAETGEVYGDYYKYSAAFLNNAPPIMRHHFTILPCAATSAEKDFVGWYASEYDMMLYPGDEVILGAVMGSSHAPQYTTVKSKGQTYTFPLEPHLLLISVWTERTYDVTFDYNFDYGYVSSTYAKNDIAMQGFLSNAEMQVLLTSDTISAQNGTKILALPEPTKNGYVFVGWYKDETAGNGTGDSIDVGGIWRNSSAITLHARWAPANVIVHLDAVDRRASLSYPEKGVTLGTAFGLLPEPRLYGYDFTGWKDAAGHFVTATSLMTSPDPITLTATYAPKTVKVLLIGNGLTFTDGSPTMEMNVTFGTAYGPVLTSQLPTAQGLRFTGWNPFADGSGYTITAANICESEGPVILYAMSEKKRYTVTLDYCENYKQPAVNLQGNSTTLITVAYGDSYPTLPIPSREGYIFKGWSLEKEPYSGSIYNGAGSGIVADQNAFIDTVKTASNHTLYAIWEADNQLIHIDVNENYESWMDHTQY